MKCDPKECAVLVPVKDSPEPETEQSLRVLANAGYAVRTLRGSSQIDLARSCMATWALAEGFKETLWIDSDIDFTVADVEKLRAHNLPFVAGLYLKKGPKEFAAKFRAGTTQLKIASEGGLVEMEYVGMGFTLIRAEVYEAVGVDLPICEGGYEQKPVVPFFIPTIAQQGDANTYLSEDYSFCLRARNAGFKVMADTSIKIGHIGRKTYTWDDLIPAGAELPAPTEQEAIAI